MQPVLIALTSQTRVPPTGLQFNNDATQVWKVEAIVLSSLG